MVILHPHATVRAAVRRGLPRRGSPLLTCASVDRIGRVLQRELVDAVVVDVLRPAVAEAAFELAASYPRIPMFALSGFRPDDGRMLASCRARGLRDLFVAGVDDVVAGEIIAARGAERARRGAVVEAPRRLRLTEPLQQRAWSEIVARVGSRTTATSVARAMGVSREHLSREFGAGGAPNLKRVIDLVRVCWAADLLANPGYSVARVSRILRYSSSSHLASAARRVAGVAPGGLGRLGPRGVLSRFLRGRTRSRL